MIQTFALILLSLLFYSGSEWELKKDKSGIQVYTRLPENSSFDEFKAIVTIENCTFYKVLDVVLDVENYESLYPDCINPEILKQDGKWYGIHYVQTKAPFPVKDRDSVIEQVTIINEDEQSARVTLKPLPDYIPEKEGIVRIKSGQGFWDIQQENNSVIVTYQYHGNPEGDVPAWLANSFVVSHPFKTMENLREIVKSNLKTNKY